MPAQGFELLQQVEALLNGQPEKGSPARRGLAYPASSAHDGGVKDPVRHECISGDYGRDAASGRLAGGTQLDLEAPAARHTINATAVMSSERTAFGLGHWGRDAAGDIAEDLVAHSARRARAVEETIEATLNGEDRAFAVLDALLTTARHNTDLTELDIVCRRVRQSEMDQLAEGLDLLEAQSRYIKRRCNVLYDGINAVNDQQAQLVACLESALQATVGDALPNSSPGRAATSSSGEGAFSTYERTRVGESLHNPAVLDDQGSAVGGSLRAPRLAAALSSSSSQTGGGGGKQLPPSTAALLTGRTQPPLTHLRPVAGGVTPYRVLGGPLDRNALRTSFSAAEAYE